MFKVGARRLLGGCSQKAARTELVHTNGDPKVKPNSKQKNQSTRKRRPERKGTLQFFLRKTLPLGTAALLGVFCFALLSDSGRKAAEAKPILPSIDKLMANLGFGIDFVTLKGHRFTSDTDVFEALSLKNARSFVLFNSGEARKRIEKLAWVKDVSIVRVLPDRIDIVITERTPFAVWHNGEALYLVDAEGRVLSGTDERAAPKLPRISGKGAPKLAARLFATLSHHPRILSQLHQAYRIVDRRWSLQLRNGAVIHLPADAESAALARLKANRQLLAHLEHDRAVIDLRGENRIVVRDITSNRNAKNAALLKKAVRLGQGSS